MSSLSSKLRPVIAGAGILGAIFASPWVPLLAMGLLAFRFRAAEVLVIGVLMDFLWLPAGSLIDPLPVFTIASLILVWGLEPLRSEFLVS